MGEGGAGWMPGFPNDVVALHVVMKQWFAR